MLITNSNQQILGDVMKSLQFTYQCGNSKYPKTVARARDLLMGQLRAECPTGKYNNNSNNSNRNTTGPNGQKNGSNNNNNEGGPTNTNKEANDGSKSPHDKEELLNLSFLQIDG